LSSPGRILRGAGVASSSIWPPRNQPRRDRSGTTATNPECGGDLLRRRQSLQACRCGIGAAQGGCRVQPRARGDRCRGSSGRRGWLKATRVAGSSMFTGNMAMFLTAGFTEIGRTYVTRPVMRLPLLKLEAGSAHTRKTHTSAAKSGARPCLRRSRSTMCHAACHAAMAQPEHGPGRGSGLSSD
jgi:hypothetical protein